MMWRGLRVLKPLDSPHPTHDPELKMEPDQGVHRPGDNRPQFSSHLACSAAFDHTAMKLDATDLRYVTPEEFRVLTAVWNSSF